MDASMQNSEMVIFRFHTNMHTMYMLKKEKRNRTKHIHTAHTHDDNDEDDVGGGGGGCFLSKKDDLSKNEPLSTLNLHA